MRCRRLRSLLNFREEEENEDEEEKEYPFPVGESALACLSLGHVSSCFWQSVDCKQPDSPIWNKSAVRRGGTSCFTVRQEFFRHKGRSSAQF